MAVALERFSIRGYAAKMRSADLGKCWPFDGDGSGSSLPPIPVRRFRLWSDELEGAGSGAAAGERPDEPQLEEAVAVAAAAAGDELVVEIPVADPAVEEERQTKAPAKAKQRAPKKRSIAELFAVAPPVEAVEEDTDGEDGAEEPEGDAGDGGRDERRGAEEESSEASRKGKERVKPEENEVKKKSNLTKEKIKKKKKKQLKVEKLAGKKEKAHKYKMSPSVNISHILQDLVHKKWFGKSPRNPIDGEKKKPTATKNLEKKNKVKLIQTSKLISRNRTEAAKLLPVHGILKNQTRGTSAKKARTLHDSHRGNLKKLCCESEKHVSFSGKDVILGHNKSCSPMELSQLRSLCKIFSDVLAASSAMDNSSIHDKLPAAAEGLQVVNVNDKDVATSTSTVVEKADGSLSEQEQLICSHGHAIPPTLIIPTNRNCTDTEKTFVAENLDLNAVQSDGDLICLNPGTSTLSPSLKYSVDPKALNFICNDGLNSDVEESFPRASEASSLLAPTRKCVSGSDTVSSLTITSTPTSQHSASCLVRSMEANGRQSQSYVDPKMDFFSHVPEFQPKHHLSPKDLMSSICSSVGSKRSGESSLTSDPGSTSKDKCIFEDFIGLPLNSQGELIKLHSGTKFGFSELYKKQNTVLGPIHGFSVPSYVEPNSSVDQVKLKGKLSGAAFYQRDQSNWFPEQYYPASKLVGFSELQGFERMKFQNHESVKGKDQFIHHNENPGKVSCHGCRENNQHHACIDRVKFQAEGILNNEFQPSIQPTVRLMGTNVTVGRSSKECLGFVDGKTWTDMDIMTEQCSSARVSDKPLPKQWPQQELVAPLAPLASGTSKENPLQPSEAQSSFYRMPPILPRSDLMHFDCQPQWVSRNGISLATGNNSSKVDLFRHPPPTQVLLNETSKSMFDAVSGTESLKMRHQIPVVASCPQNVCQHMLLSSTHCKHTQSVSYTTSASHPPFPYQDHVSLAHPSLAPCSQNLPQWLLNANQQKKNHHSSCPPYSSPVAVHHPCGLLGTDRFPLSSSYTTSMTPFPVYNTNTSKICGSFTTPDSIVHPSFIPAMTANGFSSAVNKTCQKRNKNRIGTKSKLSYFKGMDCADQFRKRPAAKDDEYMKPAKRPYLKMQEDSNAPTCPRRREQLPGYTQHNIATLESHANGNRELDAGVPVVINDKDGFRSASGSSLKFDGGSRPGPIKLSAGAKHILKPSLNMDQDCPRPIHSTIPFSIGTSSDKLLISQKKAAKVYRF